MGLKEEGASEKEDKSLIVEIDEEIKVRIDKSQLPPDAVFKGYSPYTQQDIEIKRRNRLFYLRHGTPLIRGDISSSMAGG